MLDFRMNMPEGSGPLLSCFLFALLFTSIEGLANEPRVVRTPRGLSKPKKETAVRVVGAKASYVNFEAIRRDFPEVREMSDADITRWVVENFAYINREQLLLNGMRQSEIPVDSSDVKTDYRPPGYGRAGVMEARLDGESIGMVDIKGLGLEEGTAYRQVKRFHMANGDPATLDSLRQADHSDGLMRHGEAIAELTRQTAVQRMFDIHNSNHGTDYETVETYFIIKLPFDVLGPEGRRDAAALYGRQAHASRARARKPPNIYRDPHGGFQGTFSGAAVDFGGVLVDFDPRLRDNFGVNPGGKESDPQHSRPWAWGHEVASAYGRGDSGAVYRHLEEMLEPIQREWRESKEELENNTRVFEILAKKEPFSPHELSRVLRFVRQMGQVNESLMVEKLSGHRQLNREVVQELIARLGKGDSAHDASLLSLLVSQRESPEELERVMAERLPSILRDGVFTRRNEVLDLVGDRETRHPNWIEVFLSQIFSSEDKTHREVWRQKLQEHVKRNGEVNPSRLLPLLSQLRDRRLWRLGLAELMTHVVFEDLVLGEWDEETQRTLRESLRSESVYEASLAMVVLSRMPNRSLEIQRELEEGFLRVLQQGVFPAETLIQVQGAIGMENGAWARRLSEYIQRNRSRVPVELYRELGRVLGHLTAVSPEVETSLHDLVLNPGSIPRESVEILLKWIGERGSEGQVYRLTSALMERKLREADVAALFRMAREREMFHEKLLLTASGILQGEFTTEGLSKAAAEYLASGSPNRGTQEFRDFVRRYQNEMNRIDVSSEDFTQSPVEGVRTVSQLAGSGGVCKNIFRALHPLTPWSVGDRAKALLPVTGVAGGAYGLYRWAGKDFLRLLGVTEKKP